MQMQGFRYPILHSTLCAAFTAEYLGGMMLSVRHDQAWMGPTLSHRSLTGLKAPEPWTKNLTQCRASQNR